MIKVICFVFAIFSGYIGCNAKALKSDTVRVSEVEPEAKAKLVSLDHTFKYQIDAPNETFTLLAELEEISGLGISDSGEFLYAVQDENGYIFKLSKKTGKLVDKIKFHKDGDYEGIEVVGDDVYVVKSTGTIYQLKNLGEKSQQMTKFNSFLNRENDVEGLAYDKKNHRLLVACKGVPATGESFEVIRYKKVIYEFDVATNSMNPDPVFTIQLKNIREYLEAHRGMKGHDKLMAFFSAEKENLTFNPSAISIHPISGNIYVISSSGKVMVVLDDKGKVVHIEKLKKKIHAQPEGMAFDLDGTLYISNEAKGGEPKIHRFDYQKN